MKHPQPLAGRISAVIANTSTALIEWYTPDLLVVRLKSGAMLSNAGIEELLALHGAIAEQPFGLLVTIPEDCDYEMRLMQKDHRGTLKADSFLRAIAVHTESAMLASLVDIYFAYYPVHFPTQCFREWDKAIEWVLDQGDARSVA